MSSTLREYANLRSSARNFLFKISPFRLRQLCAGGPHLDIVSSEWVPHTWWAKRDQTLCHACRELPRAARPLPSNPGWYPLFPDFLADMDE